MIDTTMVYLLTSCVAMFLVALAVTAYEFRRMSRRQDNTAPEGNLARIRTSRTR